MVSIIFYVTPMFLLCLYGSKNFKQDITNEPVSLGAKQTILIFATHSKNINGPVAQLNRASDYGSEGFRFES